MNVGEGCHKRPWFTMTFRCQKTLHRPMPRRFLKGGDLWRDLGSIYFDDLFCWFLQTSSRWKFWVLNGHCSLNNSVQWWNLLHLKMLLLYFAKEAAMAMRRVGMPRIHWTSSCCVGHVTSCYYIINDEAVVWNLSRLDKRALKKVTLDPKPVWIPTENQPYQLLHRNMSKILSIFV